MSPINDLCIRLILALIWLGALPFRIVRWIALAIWRGAPCLRDLPAALRDDGDARAKTADALGLWPEDLEEANGLWVPRAELWRPHPDTGLPCHAERTGNGDLIWIWSPPITPHKLCPVCGEEAGLAATHCCNCGALMRRAASWQLED